MQTFVVKQDGLTGFLIWQFIQRTSLLSVYILSRGPIAFIRLLWRGEMQYHESFGESILWLVFLLVWGLVYVVLKHRQLKHMTVEIDADYIVRRDGKRITRLASNEVAAARQTNESLEIKGIDRVQSIIVPKPILGYSEIEKQVGQWVIIEPAKTTTLKDLLIAAAIMVAVAIYILVADYFRVAGPALAVLIIVVVIGLVVWQAFSNPREWREGGGKFLFYALTLIVGLAVTIAFGFGVYTLVMMIV